MTAECAQCGCAPGAHHVRVGEARTGCIKHLTCNRWVGEADTEETKVPKLMHLPGNAQINCSWCDHDRTIHIVSGGCNMCDCKQFRIDAKKEPAKISHYGTQADDNPLSKWWFRQSREMADACVAKDQEYGSDGTSWDLVETGQRMARMKGDFDPTDEEAIELAILFYLGGKIARWDSAVLDGRRVSDDTLLDIATYAMMSIRNRTVGGWPNGPAESDG